ncbi:MAG: CsgG/HfaB family protein [Chlamydiota bacterium]|nr:CsgG/HfaB family protein [Chlamydiota bacterium]
MMRICGRLLILSFISVLFVAEGIHPADAARRRVSSGHSDAPPPMALPAAMGPKKTIAITKFDNKAGQWAQWDLGNGMSEMLATSLIKSGRFIVLERGEIENIIAEQDFGMSGRTAEGSAAKIGKILKAQIMISGAVTEFEANSGGGGGGFTVKGFTIGASGAHAKVAVNIRIYDTTTGQILDSQRCEGVAERSGLAFSYTDSDFGFGGNQFDRTPLGSACQMAIDKAVFFIASRMANVPWQGSVVIVKGDQVYVNSGENGGMQNGYMLDVYKPGEELIDPDTGLNLGTTLTKTGRVQIIQIQDKFSIAAPVAGGGFDRGDVLKFVEGGA